MGIAKPPDGGRYMMEIKQNNGRQVAEASGKATFELCCE